MLNDLNEKYEAVTASGESTELSLKVLLSFSQFTLFYFYPADNTPGCTVENKAFSCMKEAFQKKGITLIGVSKNSVESHKKFISDQELLVDLISDPELILHKQFGAYGEKNNYGKIVQGVIRSTFLLNQQGEIIQEWKNVKAKGHAEKVLRELNI